VVGLLICQSSLNEGEGPVLYLAPDPFLASQAMEQAIEPRSASLAAIARTRGLVDRRAHVLGREDQPVAEVASARRSDGCPTLFNFVAGSLDFTMRAAPHLKWW
jgi:hypothetical protein